jgi:hypothetical protein
LLGILYTNVSSVAARVPRVTKVQFLLALPEISLDRLLLSLVDTSRSSENKPFSKKNTQLISNVTSAYTSADATVLTNAKNYINDLISHNGCLIRNNTDKVDIVTMSDRTAYIMIIYVSSNSYPVDNSISVCFAGMNNGINDIKFLHDGRSGSQYKYILSINENKKVQLQNNSIYATSYIYLIAKMY